MVAKTLTGLEGVLAAELEALGAEDVAPVNRAVSFRGDLEILYRANLACRTATRILKPLSNFSVRKSDDLYRGVSRIDWTGLLSADDSLAVDAVISNTVFDNSLFVAQRTKDAVVDQVRSRTGRRPSVDLQNPTVRLNIHIVGREASLALDASGSPLHRRGYREEGGQAPVNEVLAAGIIALTGWDGTTPFVDPMCGSGTFLIEAALRALNVAPGLIRDRFGFQQWPDYDEALYAGVVGELQHSISREAAAPIIGSDIDARAIKAARANAHRASVSEVVRFEQKPVMQQIPPPGPGVAVMNPPYGERLKSDDLEALYRGIGDALKANYENYDAFVFTANLEAAKRVGLRTSRRITLYNGPLESRLLKYEMYRGTRKGS